VAVVAAYSAVDVLTLFMIYNSRLIIAILLFLLYFEVFMSGCTNCPLALPFSRWVSAFEKQNSKLNWFTFRISFFGIKHLR